MRRCGRFEDEVALPTAGLNVRPASSLRATAGAGASTPIARWPGRQWPRYRCRAGGARCSVVADLAVVREVEGAGDGVADGRVGDELRGPLLTQVAEDSAQLARQEAVHAGEQASTTSRRATPRPARVPSSFPNQLVAICFPKRSFNP
jgi:hypothetical protein